MFEKLVVSAADRRRRKTGKIFFLTSLFYSLIIASALVISVVAASPLLNEPVDVIRLVPMLPAPDAPKSEVIRQTPPPGGGTPTSRPPLDLKNFESLDRIVEKAASGKPPTVYGPPRLTDAVGEIGAGGPGFPGAGGGPGPVGGDIGIGSGSKELEPPPPPPQPRPQPPVQQQPVRLPSTVLSGKATVRKTPDYPIIAKQIKLQGSITVEVVISPEGRVETSRALGGHPILAQAAVAAASAWRFQPTLLNGVPVRATGVITFNFKLD